MHTPIKFKLSAPLVAWDPAKPVDEIELSPPKGIDILQAGYPFITGLAPRTGELKISVDMGAMRRLLATSAKVPDAMIDRMEANDIYVAIEAIKIFFLFEGAKASSSASSAPENGVAARPSSGT